MRVVFSLVILLLLTTPSLAGSDPRAWAVFVGLHMGQAEAAGTCPGFKINGVRRDKVLAEYVEPDLRGRLERSRSKHRAEELATIRRLRGMACSRLLAYYGPRGLLIRNYVVATTDPETDHPGIDRGKDTGVDTVAPLVLQLIADIGTAMAVEAACPGHRWHPALDELASGLGQVADKGDLMAMAVVSMAAAGNEYRLKEDRPGFCARILKDHGPDSDRPVVIRGRS